MTRIPYLEPAFVEAFPSAMDPGVLYISIGYRTCGHLCCCGCGHEVITPLSPAPWSITYNGETVSVSPSIGNWALPCQSHYWIRAGRVTWSRRYTPAEISENRNRDRRELGEETELAGPALLARWRKRLIPWRR